MSTRFVLILILISVLAVSLAACSTPRHPNPVENTTLKVLFDRSNLEQAAIDWAQSTDPAGENNDW